MKGEGRQGKGKWKKKAGAHAGSARGNAGHKEKGTKKVRNMN